MSVNKVIVLGRLGQEPELKYTPSGAAVCNFSVATTENWVDRNGQKQDRTEWHRVVVWGKLAELCNQYLAKGRQVFIEGNLQTRSWEDKTGGKRYTTEINARNVQFLGGAGKEDRPGSNQSVDRSMMDDSKNTGEDNFMNQEYDVSTDASFTADDIPF